MFSLSVQSDALPLAAFLGDKDRRRIALANAINNTAKAVQKAERENLHRKFHVRPERKTWMERQAAIIKPFAKPSVGRYYAVISVGHKPRLLLEQFEKGGEHKSQKGPNVAVPTRAARPSIDANITADLLYKQLRMKPVGKTWRGAQRTFAVKDLGIFQRVGPHRKGRPWSGTRRVYIFKPSTRLDSRLAWMDLAMSVGRLTMDAEIKKAMENSLKRELRSVYQLFTDETGD